MQSSLRVPPHLALAIPDGAAGTRETLKHMRQMIQTAKGDQALRDLAQKIVRRVPGKNWRGELDAVFCFVRDRIRYSLDTNDIETIQDAQRTLELGYGDCDDFAVLLATLLECLGHPCALCALGFSDPGEYSHVIVIVSPGGEDGWVSLDATEPNPAGWFPPGVTCDMIAPITPYAAALLQG